MQGYETNTKRSVAFYISSHGFGHLTRCLAILEAMLEQEKELHYHVICDVKQIEFATVYLARYNERVKYHQCLTDIGLITHTGRIAVDMKELNKRLRRFVKEMPQLAKREAKRLKRAGIVMVVTDITILGAYVGELLHVPVVGVSNFTWFEQYRHLECTPEIVETFEKGYAMMNYYIKYPLQLAKNLTQPTEDIGFVSRPIDRDKVAMLQEMYDSPVFISVGRSATSGDIHTDYTGTIFTTPGTHVIAPGRIVKLHPHTLDTQNYIAASRLVIAKAGWGTISEALLGKTPMVLVERAEVLEDTYNIRTLIESKLACSVKEVALGHIDMSLMLKRAIWLKTMELGNDSHKLARRLIQLTEGIEEVVQMAYQSDENEALDISEL